MRSDDTFLSQGGINEVVEVLVLREAGREIVLPPSYGFDISTEELSIPRGYIPPHSDYLFEKDK